MTQKLTPSPISKRIRKRKEKNKWTDSDYNSLITLVKSLGEDWPAISNHLPHKTPHQCMQKFKNSQKSVKRGNWAEDEDRLLLGWVKTNGPTRWTECSKLIYGRCGKQCRERWINILNPKVKKGNWSDAEQNVIFEQLRAFKTSWSSMTNVLDGRTENAIKNYFYSSLRRLRASKVAVILKNVYLEGKEPTHTELEDTLKNELNKLNLLTRRICEFLFENPDSNTEFTDFLIKLIFNKERESTVPRKIVLKTSPKQKQMEEEITQKVPMTLLYVPKDKPIQISREGYKDKRKFVISVLKNLASQKKNANIRPTLKNLINKLSNSIDRQLIEDKENGINVTLPNCWNCQTNACFKHN